MPFINKLQVVQPFVIYEPIYTLVKILKAAKIQTFYVFYFYLKFIIKKNIMMNWVVFHKPIFHHLSRTLCNQVNLMNDSNDELAMNNELPYNGGSSILNFIKFIKENANS